MGRETISTVISITVIMMAIGLGSAEVSSSSTTTPAAVPPTSAASNLAQEFLDAHNQARKEVGVGPLKWSETLAKAASLTVRYQRQYEKCAFANITNSLFGENQQVANGVEMPPLRAVGDWVAGKSFYDYGTNTCIEGRSCGGYTQVVWKNSTELGCALVQCPLQRSSLTICFYNPPGNVVGQKPY